MSHVTFHLSITPTATDLPIIHSRQSCNFDVLLDLELSEPYLPTYFSEKKTITKNWYFGCYRQGGNCECHCKYIEENWFCYFDSKKFTSRCILAVVALSDCQKVMAAIGCWQISEEVLLYVFTMEFPTSPLQLLGLKDRHTYRHGGAMTDPAQRAESVKIYNNPKIPEHQTWKMSQPFQPALV